MKDRIRVRYGHNRYYVIEGDARAGLAIVARAKYEALMSAIGSAFGLTLGVSVLKAFDSIEDATMVGMFGMIVASLVWPHVRYVEARNRAEEAIERSKQ